MPAAVWVLPQAIDSKRLKSINAGMSLSKFSEIFTPGSRVVKQDEPEEPESVEPMETDNQKEKYNVFRTALLKTKETSNMRNN